MNSRQKGFTLIELLVVIAIIGILAALVLVALGNARDKAQDARIKANVGQLRTLAEVHYDANDLSYAGLSDCLAGGTAANCKGNVLTSVQALETDTTSAGGTIVINDAADEFCVSSALKSDATQFVCVDSTGLTKTGAAGCGVATACP